MLDKKASLKNAHERAIRRVQNYSRLSPEDIINLAHDEYIEKVENFANRYWDNLPSKIESSKKSYEEAKQLYKEEQDYAKSKILKIKMEEVLCLRD